MRAPCGNPSALNLSDTPTSVKADAARLNALLGGATRYAVPYFQRSYSWERAQWQTLWEDISELYASDPSHDHFLGSVVLLTEPSSERNPAGRARAESEREQRVLLIDGQQRLVTLSLILAAARDTARAVELPLAEHLHSTYLLREHAPRILCTYQDRGAFSSVIAGQEQPEFSRINEAYRYFRGAVGVSLEKGLGLDQLAQTILSRLTFVVITLRPEDNPYRIFESLNAKGMPLTQGDLLRNYFFMRLPAAEHDACYRDVWLPMQTRLGDSFDEFMRDALVKEGSVVRDDEVYQGWRQRLAPRSAEEVKSALKELAAAAADYDGLLHPQREPDPGVRRRLELMTTWSNAAFHSLRPFLLQLYAEYKGGGIDGASVEQVLLAVESFLVRRLFVSTPPADESRLLIELYQHSPARPSPGSKGAAFWEALSRPEWGWPGDEEFREAVVRCPLFFRSHPDQRRLVMKALEESYPHPWQPNYGGLEIELVAPLLVRPDWLAELGGDEDLHWRLVGTLGNLTWGRRGASYSLTPAERKRELAQLGRFGLQLSRDLANKTPWTANMIQDRSRNLADRAVAVWPGPRR